MSIAFQCDQCGKNYAADDKVAGKAMKCKACGKVLRIPGGSPRAAATAPPKPAAATAKPTAAARAVPPVPPPIPGRAAGSAAPASKPKPKAPTPPPVAAASAPPDLDLFGLADEPAPGLAARGPALAGDGDDAPLILPRAGTPPKPKSKEEKKKWEKKVKQKDCERRSFSQPVFGISFGAALSVTFFFVRMYNRVNRVTRAFNDPSVSADFEPGMAPTPRPPRVVGPITLPAFPDPGPGQQIEPGVMLHEIRLGPDGVAPPMPGHRGKLWLYLPAGDHAPGSLPCVLTAGAGSPLIWGMNLGMGDRAEHLPYARAGFAVLAYELDGAYDDESEDDEDVAIEAFVAAKAGLVNAHNAIEYVLARVPQVDRSRIFAAGHSSAGTMALLFAENEPRLAGCVAYAPAVDTGRNFNPELRAQLGTQVPGAGDLFTRYNPMMHEADIKCPVFLFHAMDDSNVPVSESQQCQARLQQLGKSATLEVVPTGDHYNSMIQQGLPRGIAWLKSLPPASPAAAPTPAPDQQVPPGQPAPPPPGMAPGAGVPGL